MTLGSLLGVHPLNLLYFLLFTHSQIYVYHAIKYGH